MRWISNATIVLVLGVSAALAGPTPQDKPTTSAEQFQALLKEQVRKVKEVMVKEKLNWRSFVDQGEIAAKWKPAGTPAFFIIDQLRC